MTMPTSRPQRHFNLAHPRGARRRATCAQIRCGNFERGWTTVLPIGHHLIEWLRHQDEWKFTERQQDEGLIAFEFPAGQKCFEYKKHLISDALFLGTSRVDGESRVILYPDGDYFVEDWDKHLRTIKAAIDG